MGASTYRLGRVSCAVKALYTLSQRRKVRDHDGNLTLPGRKSRVAQYLVIFIDRNARRGLGADHPA